MKVIRVSNYDHVDWRGDQVMVAGPNLSQEEAEAECEKLCDDPRRSNEDWYQVMPDAYNLFKFEP
jgi:hypothetical protein